MSKRKNYNLIIFFAWAMVFAQWPFRKDLEWYLNGPEKEWSQRDHERYFKRRDRIDLKRISGNQDDQILRRQKAILNGYKISTEIWNYGSISSP